MLACFLIASNLFSTEIDSFTLRDPNMRDGLQELDAIMQRNFDLAISEANKAQSCEPRVFEQAFRKTVKGPLWSKFEDDIENSTSLDKRTTTRGESIYRDVTLYQGIALYMAKLGYLIRIGDLYVGSDKFGHFLETGYDYTQKSTFEEALYFGEMTERTYFGLSTTGVYSYGDLAANLDGYIFWKNLAAGEDNPYVVCQDNLWKQQMRFTWADFVNAAWDEGINCNYYSDLKVLTSVSKRIRDLGMSCPVETNHCTNMIERYGYLAAQVIHQGCFLDKN